MHAPGLEQHRLRRRRQTLSQTARRLAAPLLACCLVGCGTLDIAPKWASSRLRMNDVSIAGEQGPEERRLRTVAHERFQRDRDLAPPDLAVQFAELEAAQKLYDSGRFPEAEQAYQAALKKYAPRKGMVRGLFNRHQFDLDPQMSPVEEDALFMLGQSRFKQGKLAGAEESYSALLAKYPSTRHLDTVSRQLFRISREWLGFPDEQDSEIAQVAYGEKIPTLEQRRNRDSGWFPNLRDKTRPTFDLDGHALEALKLIWLHDSAGPLADDALMMAANYHLRQGNVIDAAQHYRLLQEQFPDSPHFKDSLMLGSHVLLASYNGAAYDPSPLEEAKQLKLMALQYPDLDADDRARIEQELDELAEAEVAPLWKEIEFYIAKRQRDSVILHCNYLINKHPNSKYARMAAVVKADYEGTPRSAIRWPQAPAALTERQPRLPRPDPAPARAPAEAPAMSGAQDLTQPEGSPVYDPPADRTPSPPPGEAVPATPPPQEPRRYFDRFLRRADQPPGLQPVSPPTAPDSTNSFREAVPAGAESTGRVRLQSPPPYPRLPGTP